MPTKRTVDYSDYANQIVKAIPRGILLTTKADEKVNAMTIGWGTLGTNWSRPVFVAYVRRHRSTIAFLDRNPEFTINVPLEERPSDRKIIGICGSERGDEVDKVALADLTLVDSDVVSVPGIAELPLTLECRVIYRQDQELSLYSPDIMAYYPQDVDGRATGSNRDPHITFFGEIVNAYVIEG